MSDVLFKTGATDHVHTNSCGCAPQTPGSIRDIEAFILDLNSKRSREYMRARSERQDYAARHGTQISVFKCMDGRLDFAVMTKALPGTVRPFRNIGGQFDLGWPHLGDGQVRRWQEAGTRAGNKNIALAAYHFSKGEPHRGCKGFNYDTEKARAASEELREQFLEVAPRATIYPITIGMETDENALIFHNEKGDAFNVADHVDMPFRDLEGQFTELYPDMIPKARTDLLQRVMGNQEYIVETRQLHREPAALNHQEQVIIAGDGVDYIHMPNLALIVGPYSLNWSDHIAVAGSIVLSNFKEGRVQKDAGRMLLVSALCEEPEGSIGWEMKRKEVNTMRKHALEALEKHVPELLQENFSVMGGIVAADTRKFHRCF